MSWKSEQRRRVKKQREIDKEIAKLRKESRNIGTTDGLEIIREMIELRYKVPTRIRNDVGCNHRRLVLYSQNATDKQIRYGRPEKELGSITVSGRYGELSVYVGKEYPEINIPDTIEDVYRLIMEMGG